MSFEAAADQVAPGTPTVAPTVVPPATSTPTVLEDGRIVINGKVFTPEAVATKVEHADKHITTLETENAEKDEKLAKLLERIEAMEAKSGHADNTAELAKAAAAAAVAAAAPEAPSTQEVSKEDILAAVKDDLKAEQLAAQREANMSAVVAEAKAAYGAEFGEKVDALAVEHGMTPEDAVDMAKNKPAVFRALFLKGAAPKANAGPDVTGNAAGGESGLAPTTQVAQKTWSKLRGAKERKAFIDARYAEIAARNPT